MADRLRCLRTSAPLASVPDEYMKAIESPVSVLGVSLPFAYLKVRTWKHPQAYSAGLRSVRLSAAVSETRRCRCASTYG